MKRIQLTIEPMDNGYVVTGQVTGANPNENFSARLVAKDDKEAQQLGTKVLADAFTAAKTESSAPAGK